MNYTRGGEKTISDFAENRTQHMPRDRINFVLILGDDWGYGDLSVYASGPEAKLLRPTPNLAALAAQGTAFTEFYSVSPECTPSRAAFLTGRAPGDRRLRMHLCNKPKEGAAALKCGNTEIVKMLQSGGHVYICGGTAMGRDVVAAVQEAVRVHGGLPAEAADAYIKAMQTQGRLVQELWS